MNTPLLIGLMGRSKAGKDTVGRILVSKTGKLWTLASFAAPIKRICGEVFRFSDEQIHGDAKEVPDPRYQRADGSFLTPREAMQKCGTEFGRSCYPEIWVDLCIRNAKQAQDVNTNVAITDCRFLNEAKAIKAAGGQLWRIMRPEADNVPAAHLSETEMNRPEVMKLVDKMINNVGTIEDLEEKVKIALDPRRWDVCIHDVLKRKCEVCEP